MRRPTESEQPMTKKVTQFPADRIARQQPATPDPTNISELGLPEDATPQELLALMSRDPNVENVLVVVPTTHVDEDGNIYQDVEVLSAGQDMDNAHINWLCDKVKLAMLGIEV